jgi:hypothetical protein
VSIFGGPGEQVCAVTIVPTGDTVADVHTVVDTSLLGASLPSMLREMTPTLSGAVYENTLEGRQPVPNARVELDGLGGLGLPIAETRTDADGRYVLCAVPQIAGLYLYASAPGFDLFELGHDLLGLTTLDIVLRRRN